MTPNTSALVAVAVLTVLATARLTRLATGDTLTEPLRTFLDTRAQLRPNDDGTARLAPAPWRFLAAVLRCHWCSSIWISAGTSTAYLAWATDTAPWHWTLTTWFFDLLSLLAVSHAVATAADWLDSPPPVKPVDLRITRDDR